MSPDHFLSALSQTSFAGGVLVVLVLATQKLFRRALTPSWKCALWLLVALRLLLPSSFTSDLSLFNLLPGSTTSAEPTPREAVPAPAIDFGSANSAATGAPLIIPADAHPAATPPILSIVRIGAWLQANAVSALFSLWLVGAAIVAVALARSAIVFARATASAKLVRSPEVTTRMADCAAALNIRRVPKIFTTGAVTTPALHGLLRPRVLVPERFLQTFTPDEQRFVFLHELAHVRRHDLWLNWVMATLQAVHWFNPLVWFAFARWRADREVACDAAALEAIGAEHSRAYGQTMLRLLALFRLPLRGPGAVGILENNRDLRTRIAHIARFQPKRRSTLAITVFAAVAWVGLTDAQVPAPLPASPPVTANENESAVDQAVTAEITSRFGGDRRKYLDHLRQRGLTQREYRREVAANLRTTATLPRPSTPYVLFLLNASDTMLHEYTPRSSTADGEKPERSDAYAARGSTQTDQQKRSAPKWNRALHSVENMLRALPPDRAFYVAILSDGAVRPIGSRAAMHDPNAIAATMNELRTLVPGGSVNLEAAFAFVAHTLPTPAPERMVVITDGLPGASDAYPRSRDNTEAERITAFQAAMQHLPARIPVHTVLLSTPSAEPAAAGLFWQLAHATRGQLTVPARAATAPRTHLAFVVDSSGSMRDPNTGGLWPTVISSIEATLDTQPQLVGLQLLDGDGRFILGRKGSGAAAWLPNTPEVRAQLTKYLQRYSQDSISDPAPGVANALRFLHDKTGTMRMGIYVLGDEFIARDNPIAVLDRIEELNPRDRDGQRLSTISAIGFPTTVRTPFSMGNTGIRFADLMRNLVEAHDGSFIALPEL